MKPPPVATLLANSRQDQGNRQPGWLPVRQTYRKGQRLSRPGKRATGMAFDCQRYRTCQQFSGPVDGGTCVNAGGHGGSVTHLVRD